MPLAVTAARGNAERNGLADRVEAREGTLPAAADERYPLVLANLVAAVLVELAAPLGRAPRAGWHAPGERHHRAACLRGGGAMRAAGPRGRRAPRRRRVGLVAPGAAGMTLHRFFVAPEALDGDRFPLPASIERQVRARAAAGRRRSDRPAARRRVRGHLPARRRRVRGRGAVGGGQRAAAPADCRAGAPQGRCAGGGRAARDRDRRRRLPARRHGAMRRPRDLAAQAGAAAGDRSGGGRAVGARDRATGCRAGAVRDALAAGSVLLFERQDGAGLAQMEPPPTARRHRPRGRLQPGRGDRGRGEAGPTWPARAAHPAVARPWPLRRPR